MRKNKICIVGWHYFELLFQKLLKLQEDIHVVAHRPNPILDKLSYSYSLKDNIGLEFGAYDYYIKNIWDKNSHVLFMHDDCVISDHKTVLDIISEGTDRDIDQAFVFNNEKEAKQNGNIHGRGMFLSPSFINYKLENNDGIWFDPDAIDGFPPSPNSGIFRFAGNLKSIERNTGMKTHRNIFNKDFKQFRVGKRQGAGWDE